MNAIWKWFKGWTHRGPHFVIGDPQQPYMKRWYILPRNPILNVYLHQFLHDDDDRALHDHPWPSVSICVKGRLRDITESRRREIGFGGVAIRRSTHAHRIELLTPTAWTLFLTGPTLREWGFHCPQGWVHWRDFVDHTNTGNIGKGCG